jgi:hypothetical protein
MKHKKVLGIFFLTCLVLSFTPSISVYGKMHKIEVVEDVKDGISTYLHIEHYRHGVEDQYRCRSPYTGYRTGWLNDYDEAKRLIKKYHEDRNYSNCWYKEHRVFEGDILIDELWKENDLMLYNFFNYTAQWVSGRGKDDVISCKDDQGQTDYLDDHEAKDQDWKIRIGTGSNAPGITNYTLQTETHNELLDSLIYSGSDDDYNITFTSFFTFTGSYNITECGMSMYLRNLGDDVFLTRDVFDAVNVVDEDTLAVSIIINYNGGGMTTAMWKFLRGMTDNNIDDSNYNLNTLKNTNGDTLGTFGGTVQYWQTGDPFEMWIGTSNTAFDVDDYNLGNKVMVNTIADQNQVSIRTDGNDCNVIVIGYFSPDQAYDIYEIGIVVEVYFPVEGGDEELLLCRKVLDSPYSVDLIDHIAVYLTWSFVQS